MSDRDSACEYPGSPYWSFSANIKYYVLRAVAFDESNLILYVTLSQIFSVWIWPFHVSPATLTVKLHLTTDREGESAPPPRHPVETDDNNNNSQNHHSHDPTQTNGDTSAAQPTLYYIAKQEDLYQTSEWIKFFLPHIGYWLVVAGQLLATLACIVGVYALWPIMWLEEKRVIPERLLKGGNLVYNIEKKIPEIKRE